MTLRTTPTLLALALALFAWAGAASAQTAESGYTALGEKSCKTLKLAKEEADSSLQECPGVAGFKLLVEEGDLRQNITVVTPGGAKHSLDLWSVVSSGFSSVGPKAEWRVRRRGGKVEPFALIVRFNASENPEDSSKITSYLVVSKITPGKICVTDKIAPAPGANEEARRAADNSATKPCLK